MKVFNRKRLIPSLAASAMIAAATLAPFATVHAAPANFISISNPAHIDLTTGTGLNGIVVSLTYNCTGGAGAATAIAVTAANTPSAAGVGTGPASGTGSTGDFSATGTPIAPSTTNSASPLQGITCNGTPQQIAATIFADPGTSFNLGTATVTAKLVDNTNTTIGTAVTATVRVI